MSQFCTPIQSFSFYFSFWRGLNFVHLSLNEYRSTGNLKTEASKLSRIERYFAGQTAEATWLERLNTGFEVKSLIDLGYGSGVWSIPGPISSALPQETANH